MDSIHIDGLHVYAYHGVFEHENVNGQNFYVNAVLDIDTEKAGLSDELELTEDYGKVCELITKIMTENTFKLIEAAAQAVAGGILRAFPLVKGAEVEIRKPEAPVELEFSSLSVKVRRSWHDAVIALGSNMGDSREIINKAIDEIKGSDFIKDVRASELIVTKPYGYTDQDDFVNGALICRTFLSPSGLLDLLHKIENEAGRKREIHWGPRTLDLDIIFYDDLIMDSRELTIPHCDMHNRRFVLAPVNEIAPYYRHPLLGATVKELLERLDNKC